MGTDRTYYDHAYTLGRILANNGITVVFGGGKVGLMGALAEGAIHHDGRVVGIIPSFLKTKEIAHDDVSELIVVENMHERKMRMHAMSEGIIAMPGGWGTMEEMFEMLTWGQLGLHQKPMGMLNVNGFYDSLRGLADMMVAEGFLKQEIRDMLLFSESIDELLEMMDSYIAPDVPKWVTKKTT